MGRSEVSYYPPGLRRLPAAEIGEQHVEVQSLMSEWIRVVLVDGRVFVGSLKALDRERNLVLMNAVEIRPFPDGREEKKAHRGYCMINTRHIVSIGRRKKSEK